MRKSMCHLDLLQRLPSKDNWMKKIGFQKLLEVVKTHNKSNQKPKIQL